MSAPAGSVTGVSNQNRIGQPLSGSRSQSIGTRDPSGFTASTRQRRIRSSSEPSAVSTDLSRYQEWLDQLWDIFGENRVMFGSDWPQSESVELDSYPSIMTVTHAYLSGKGRNALEKVLWKNSVQAYRWVKHEASHPQL